MFLSKVWKKEFTPCDGELSALRRGEEWDPVKYQQEKEEKEWRDKLEEERSRALNKVSLCAAPGDSMDSVLELQSTL